MAFGIDDALAAAAAGINLTDTIVHTIKRYRQSGGDIDIELLVEEVRITALKRIDDADMALVQLERMLIEKRVDLNESISDVIAATPIYRPFEQHRLRQIRKRFNELSDSIYSATDDIASLVRCRDRAKEFGIAVVESTASKHDLHSRLVNARSIGEAIDLLRKKLIEHKTALSQ